MNLIDAALVAVLASTVSVTAFTPVSNFNFRTSTSTFNFELQGKKWGKLVGPTSDLSDDAIQGKKVLVRCDMNVPLDGNTITDDSLIRASITHIEFFKGKGAIVTVCSAKDDPKDESSFGPCAARMGELLGQDVKLVGDCIGDVVKEAVDSAKQGDVLMLENSQFYKEESKNEPELFEKLVAPFDMDVEVFM